MKTNTFLITVALVIVGIGALAVYSNTRPNAQETVAAESPIEPTITEEMQPSPTPQITSGKR